MQPEQRSAPRADLDLERDWFWTGVPAGFIVAVLALASWQLASIWVGAAVILVLIGAGAVWATRDGAQCRAMFTLGSLLLLLPTAIVGFVVIHHFVGT